MHDFQRAFIDFALETGVLRFGEFTLKSGRTSPYFFNAGLFNTGGRLARLAEAYAETIVASGIEYDVLLGPAYKGIPLAAATSVQLSTRHDRDVPWCFNRKEAKDHGEGGLFVGAPLTGRVLVIDDVITAGTAIREVRTLIEDAGATLAGVVVAVDRQERGTGDLSAIGEVERDFGAPVRAIVTLDQIIAHLETAGSRAGSDGAAQDAHLAAVRAYRAEYGVPTR